MEFSRHEYWSGLPFPSPGDLPNPGVGPKSPTLHAGFFFLPSEPQGKPRDIGWPQTIPVYLLKRKKPCNPAHHLIFIGFCILVFLSSSCPSLGDMILFFFFSFIFISWRLITLQYCSVFCHTLTWISHSVQDGCLSQPVFSSNKYDC